MRSLIFDFNSIIPTGNILGVKLQKEQTPKVF
jgi:hypothetical protein